MASPSFWIDAVGGPPPRRAPAPAQGFDCDVAIVGGGYTGLWTAYWVARSAPDLTVAVLEREFCGYGASGRNGGWVVGELAGSFTDGRLRREIRGAPAAIGPLLAAEEIDCDFRLGGTLTVARTAVQEARLRAGAEDGTEWLDGPAVRARVAIPGVRGAVFAPWCARVQPARLVFGLAAACERRGVRIHESTAARAVAPGRVALASGAEVRAGWVIRATEGFTSELAGEKRTLLPLASSMVVTEPIGEPAWAEIGWAGAETLADGAHVYCYAQRTADGRIALGGRGNPYRFGSRTDPGGRTPEATVAALTRMVGELFPVAREVPIARAWSGVLGVPRDWGMQIGAEPGLAWAGGYVGEGVAAAWLAGRILAEIVTGAKPDLQTLPVVGRRVRRWEPEPLRWLGVQGAYAAYRAADRREARTGRPSRLAALADRVTRRG